MDELDPLMAIGPFSRASLVSVKALRSYHAQGLLVPAWVDPMTNHRAYRVSQLADARAIRRLRDLDVPLTLIGEVLTARDPEVTRKVIAEHEATMRERLDAITRIVEALHGDAVLPDVVTPIHLRQVEPMHVLAVTGTVSRDEYAAFLDDAYTRLFAALQMLGLAPTGPSGALYPAEVGDHETVVAFLPVAAPVPLPIPVRDLDVQLDLLPAATVAVATHAGPFDTIGDTYQLLGAWVAGNANSAGLPVREHYVVSIDPETGRLLPDDQLRTEILWPVMTV